MSKIIWLKPRGSYRKGNLSADKHFGIDILIKVSPVKLRLRWSCQSPNQQPYQTYYALSHNSLFSHTDQTYPGNVAPSFQRSLTPQVRSHSCLSSQSSLMCRQITQKLVIAQFVRLLIFRSQNTNFIIFFLVKSFNVCFYQLFAYKNVKGPNNIIEWLISI